MQKVDKANLCLILFPRAAKERRGRLVFLDREACLVFQDLLWGLKPDSLNVCLSFLCVSVCPDPSCCPLHLRNKCMHVCNNQIKSVRLCYSVVNKKKVLIWLCLLSAGSFWSDGSQRARRRKSESAFFSPQNHPARKKNSFLCHLFYYFFSLSLLETFRFLYFVWFQGLPGFPGPPGPPVSGKKWKK